MCLCFFLGKPPVSCFLHYNKINLQLVVSSIVIKSFIWTSQIIKLPKSRGLIFNFQFGKTLRASSEAVVVPADRDCPTVCAFRAVTAYISAAQRMGWDLTAGHLFAVVTAEGSRGSLPLSTARMTTASQDHLRAAGLPSHFTMYSFRVGGSWCILSSYCESFNASIALNEASCAGRRPSPAMPPRAEWTPGRCIVNARLLLLSPYRGLFNVYIGLNEASCAGPWSRSYSIVPLNCLRS